MDIEKQKTEAKLDYTPFDPQEELAKIRKFSPEEKKKLTHMVC